MPLSTAPSGSSGSAYRIERHQISGDGNPVVTNQQFTSEDEFAVTFKNGRKLVPGELHDYTYDTESREIRWSEDVATYEAKKDLWILVEFTI